MNGSFDEWSGDVPSGWDKVKGWQKETYDGTCHRDAVVQHGGTPSLRLENLGDADIVQVSCNIPIASTWIKPGRTYRLRAAARVEALARPNGIQLAALTPDLKSRGSWRISFPPPGDWTTGAVEFTVPEGATFLRLMIHVAGTCRLWVDDILMDERVDDVWRPLVLGGVPPENDILKRWVELFHGEGTPYLLLGRMLHPPILLAPLAVVQEDRDLPPILLNAFEAPDGRVAVVVVNATDDVQLARFAWRGQEWTLPMEPWEVALSDEAGHFSGEQRRETP